MRLRLTPVTLIYIITSTYYNSTFDLLLKDAEIHKFGSKTELMSHAPMRSTASSSSHRGRDISDSCSTIMRELI